MKVLNPNYKSPVQAFAESNGQAVANYLENRAGQKEITFDEVRADFSTVADPVTGEAPMTDGTIAAIFQHLGYEVTE